MQLQCPVPKLDFDVITLGHGSGGMLTSTLLDNSIFDLFNNEILASKDDGAVIETKGQLAFSTDSFIVSPIQFPGGDIGELAINGTVNDLSMCGSIPKYLSLSFILEEGLEVETFWQILLSIKHASERAGIQIITGDTKVVEKGKGDKIFINTSGIGEVIPNLTLGSRHIESGDVIIVSGQVASHGMAIMSVRQGLTFDSEIQSDTQPLNHVVSKLLGEYGDAVRFLTDPTRGGVATVLKEIADQESIGIQISQESIPVDHQVEGACELLGLDPLYVANEGIFIAVVCSSKAEKIVKFLQNQPETPHANSIGHFTSDHPKEVVLKTMIGGKRSVNRLPGEQLPRIC